MLGSVDTSMRSQRARRLDRSIERGFSARHSNSGPHGRAALMVPVQIVAKGTSHLPTTEAKTSNPKSSYHNWPWQSSAMGVPTYTSGILLESCSNPFAML